MKNTKIMTLALILSVALGVTSFGGYMKVQSIVGEGGNEMMYVGTAVDESVADLSEEGCARLDFLGCDMALGHILQAVFLTRNRAGRVSVKVHAMPPRRESGVR